MDYDSFLKSKVKLAKRDGFDIGAGCVNPALKPHQSATVRWMVSGGRRACFMAFGLGKSVIQLEVIRIVLGELVGRVSGPGPRGLIVCPLNVRQEFINDARSILGWTILPKFIRRIEEADGAGVYLTNYETVREGKLDPAQFDAASLDEASILRGFGGTKTFREVMRLFTGDGGPTRRHRTDGKTVPYRFVATATPSPNEYIELLAYADFLGIMDISQAKTRFFKRDSTKADKLTLHPHKEREFWLWVASWAVFVQRPSDLGFSDEGYALPELEVHWHEVAPGRLADSRGSVDRSGQGRMIRDAAAGLSEAAAEKRASLTNRLAKLQELRRLEPEAHRIIWHDLEDERRAIERAFPSVVSVYGSQDLEEREGAVAAFSDGRVQELAAKPVMLGSGCNLQRHCAWEIFLGIGFKFNDFIQAIHRVYRFLQTRRVRLDLIYTEAERPVRAILEDKWKRHNEMVKAMTKIVKEFGLAQIGMASELTRKMGVERVEVVADREINGQPAYRLINNDCVKEASALPENSCGLILTSIPFSTQYEYSPNYADFGHSEGNEEFFGQMDYLTPHLLRTLKPGRIAAIHVKDRIVPGGLNGLGFQTVYPFHAECIRHFVKHGFGYMGMKTIVTDVVRENNQTYRLGWTEQCKDGTKMGVGMPEYLLLFRKPQSNGEKSYADEPVIKSKGRYTRARWQTDAHGFTRSSGNRLLLPEELGGLTHQEIFRLFRDYSMESVYSFEHHVKLGEALERKQMLPVKFMLLQPQSWAPDVWTDITRMLTLNSTQSARGKTQHLCPLQFDICDRVIEQMSNAGDVVLDPFGGIMTVPYRAVKLGRVGWGIELNSGYFLDGCGYCKAAAEELAMPDLFGVLAGSGEGGSQ